MREPVRARRVEAEGAQQRLRHGARQAVRRDGRAHKRREAVRVEALDLLRDLERVARKEQRAAPAHGQRLERGTARERRLGVRPVGRRADRVAVGVAPRAKLARERHIHPGLEARQHRRERLGLAEKEGLVPAGEQRALPQEQLEEERHAPRAAYVRVHHTESLGEQQRRVHLLQERVKRHRRRAERVKHNVQERALVAVARTARIARGAERRRMHRNTLRAKHELVRQRRARRVLDARRPARRQHAGLHEVQLGVLAGLLPHRVDQRLVEERGGVARRKRRRRQIVVQRRGGRLDLVQLRGPHRRADLKGAPDLGDHHARHLVEVERAARQDHLERAPATPGLRARRTVLRHGVRPPRDAPRAGALFEEAAQHLFVLLQLVVLRTRRGQAAEQGTRRRGAQRDAADRRHGLHGVCVLRLALQRPHTRETVAHLAAGRPRPRRGGACLPHASFAERSNAVVAAGALVRSVGVPRAVFIPKSHHLYTRRTAYGCGRHPLDWLATHVAIIVSSCAAYPAGATQ